MLPTISVLIREELIDRLLIQELACDSAFTSWFISRCLRETADSGRLVELNQSRTRRGRETDVEVHWRRANGRLVVLLIENKIDAAFQSEQLEDYHERGKGLVRDGKVDEYRVVLLAPRLYLASSPQSQKADEQVPYEELSAYFDAKAPVDVRHAYAARIFAQAIGKGQRIYVGVADRAVTDFWGAYLDRFSKALPGWGPKKANWANGARPEKSDIIYLYPPDRTLPGLRIAHKLKRRELELSFEGIANQEAEFEAYFAQRLPMNAALEWSGAKGAIRSELPRVSPWDPLEPQAREVDTAIAVAAGLVEWFAPHADWWRGFRARAKETG